MTIILLLAIGAILMLHRLNSRQRLIVILVAMVLFALLGCETGGGATSWNIQESKDVTGFVWRNLP